MPHLGNEVTEKKAQKRRITPIINLIAALIALIAALISLWIAFVNQKQIKQQDLQIESQGTELIKQKVAIDKQSDEIFRMRALASNIALEVTIDSPISGGSISAVFDGMKGTFRGSLPDDHQMWVLARDRHNYFLMYPPTQVVHSLGTWSQKGVRLGSPGSWELLLCIANANASLWLKNRADQQNWGGFKTLPQGLEIVGSVDVTRQ